MQICIIIKTNTCPPFFKQKTKSSLRSKIRFKGLFWGGGYYPIRVCRFDALRGFKSVLEAFFFNKQTYPIQNLGKYPPKRASDSEST